LSKHLAFQGMEVTENDVLVISQNARYIFKPKEIDLNISLPKIYNLSYKNANVASNISNEGIKLNEAKASFEIIPESVGYKSLFGHVYR